MSDNSLLSRRGFLKSGTLFTSGLLIAFHLPAIGKTANTTSSNDPNGLPPLPPADPNAYLRIAPDGTITIIVSYAELGQGTYTAMSQLIADELDADWTKIKVEAAPTDMQRYAHPMFHVQMTGASNSTVGEWERMRKVGAIAKSMLVAAAAKTWNVSPNLLTTNNGWVIGKSGQKVSYGELAMAATNMPVQKDVKLKDPKDWKFIGQRVKRLDTPEKTNGQAKFGIDVSLPGLLVAVVARTPYFGGKVKNFNADKTKVVPGVKAVIPVPNGIAVVAISYWQAKKGKELLEIEWDGGPLGTLNTPDQMAEYKAMLEKPGLVAMQKGDVSIAAGVAKTFSVDFEFPYLAHAPMEPLNCTVDAKLDGCDIYVGTQGQTFDQMAVAGVLKLKPEQVRLHNHLVGGGFGRRCMLDAHVAVEAAIISMAVQAPIKVIWMREDDIKGGYYRSASQHRMKTTIDKAGYLLSWQLHMVTQSYVFQTPFEGPLVKDGVDGMSVDGSTDIVYEVPNLRIEWTRAPDSVPTLWQRSNSHFYTGYMKETLMDVMAKAAGKDPYQFRLSLLKKNTEHLAILKLVAERSGWGKPLPAGRARGIAIHSSFGSTLAMVSEVSLTDRGAIKVHKITTVIDCGPAINPANVEAQVQGSVVFAMSAALYGNITLKAGRVEQSNFNSYRMLRMHESPPVDVHLVNYSKKIGGVGEACIAVVSPSIANAVFALTENHLTTFPFPADVRKKG